MGSVRKTKKNIPRSINEMSKETLQETLKKKRECNAKALMTVEKLCETNINEEWFLDNLQYINQCHFDDVVVERAITKLCGYPLCDKKLDNIPAQQYHISTRYNRVFDITERKNFCSSGCYKSGVFVKKQLFTSPLWFRDQEVIPKYKVLNVGESSFKEEMVQPSKSIKMECESMKETKTVDKLGGDGSKSVDEVEEMCKSLKLDDVDETKLNAGGGDRLNNTKHIENAVSCDNQTSEEIKKSVKAKEEPVDTVTKIEKHIFEWFSLDTIFYLYGDEKLKEMFHDKAVKVKEIINLKLSMAGYNEKIEKIIKLYGLLDSDLVSKNEIKANLKPLPDYSVLKEEGKTLEIKVRAFYQGQLEVKPQQEKEEEKKEEEKIDSEPIYLPLVDAHAQNALRRKIVLDKLNRVLPELVRVFNPNHTLQMNEVRNLVSSLTLSAHNIVFKPREWYLVGIVILKLLCLKDKKLESLITSESAKSQITLILMNYQLNSDYVDDFIHRLTDDTNIIMKLSDINQ